MLSKALAISFVLVVVLSGCSSDTDESITEDTTVSQVVAGFTDKELRSPEFKECLETLVILLVEDKHQHIYNDQTHYTDWGHTHTVEKNMFGDRLSYEPYAGSLLETTLGKFNDSSGFSDESRTTDSKSNTSAKSQLQPSCNTLLGN